MSDKGGVTGFVEKMMQLTMNRQENIPEPNLKARIFAAVHFILCECYFCPFLSGIVEDRGWPCARLFQKGEAIYTLDDREMRVTILNDASFYYLYVYFPPTETSYFILDISEPMLPLFESTNEKDQVPVHGEAFALDVSIHLNFVCTLKSRIGSEILNKIGNSVIRKNEFSMVLINFSIKNSKKRKAAASEGKSSDQAVRAKIPYAYSKIRELVPNNCNIGSKLMGLILFIARDASACTLDTERHEWPVVLDYSDHVTELSYNGYKYFFSLLEHETNFYLTVRNRSSILIAAKKIPKIVCPTFTDSDVKVDSLRISRLARWLNQLFLSVIEEDINRLRGSVGSSIRSSTSSLC